MSKKLFAALSLSVLLVACQGAVTTDDTAMDAEVDVVVEDTSADDAMMEDTSTGVVMEDAAEPVVEMDVDAEAAVVAE